MSVTHRVEDRAGRIETREIILPARATLASEAERPFGAWSGYALTVDASAPLIAHSFTARTQDAVRVQDGTRTRATEAAQLSKFLLFEQVPADPRTAIVLVAPGSGASNAVRRSLTDREGGLLDEANRTLLPNRPHPIFPRELFGAQTGNASLSVEAETALAGTLFLFDADGDPITLEATALMTGD